MKFETALILAGVVAVVMLAAAIAVAVSLALHGLPIHR